MEDVDRLVKGHLDAWTIPDTQARAAVLSRIYTENVTIVEPDRVLRGREELNERIGELQQHFGGLEFTMLDVLHNQNYALYHWGQTTAERSEPITGWDVLTFEGELIAHAVMFIPEFDDLGLAEPA